MKLFDFKKLMSPVHVAAEYRRLYRSLHNIKQRLQFFPFCSFIFSAFGGPKFLLPDLNLAPFMGGKKAPSGN
jgi:hypothetical protein